jgi:hypothetical protein
MNKLLRWYPIPVVIPARGFHLRFEDQLAYSCLVYRARKGRGASRAGLARATGLARRSMPAQQFQPAERPLTWTQEAPPAYIWGRRPGWVVIDVGERAMRLYWDRFLKPRSAEVRDLVGLALSYHRRAIAG